MKKSKKIKAIDLFFEFLEASKTEQSKEVENIEQLMLEHILAHPKLLKKVETLPKLDILIRVGIKHENYELCELVLKEKKNICKCE
jgi:hypothetical protein